jgi:hypothetical protein
MMATLAFEMPTNYSAFESQFLKNENNRTRLEDVVYSGVFLNSLL